MDPDPEAQEENIPLKTFSEYGKPSMISDYCNKERAASATSCLWVCFEEHGLIRARDIEIKDDAKTFDLRDVLRHRAWWKRYSMYSIVDVQEVEIEFQFIEKDKVFVLVFPIQCHEILTYMDEELGRLNRLVKDHGRPECGIPIDGTLDYDNHEECPNTVQDEQGDRVCTKMEMHRVTCRAHKVRRGPALLRFYWTMKIPMPKSELHQARFIHTYRRLQTLTYYDAMMDGQSIKAIYLVLGWDWKYITALLAAGIGFSICATVVTALATHDIDTGWSAGSYAVAIVSIILGLFSALSRLL